MDTCITDFVLHYLEQFSEQGAVKPLERGRQEAECPLPPCKE